MRHNKKGKIFSRKKAPREAMLRNLATSLVLYEKVITTKAKAKVIKSIVEKYITLGKLNTLHARRQMLKYFYLENAARKIIEDLAPRYKDRHGGYLRTIKIGRRLGDAGEKVRIMFV